MSLRALAKEAGISTLTMSYLMNGKTKPQICTILMFCNVLGVTIGELFDGEYAAASKETLDSEEPGKICGEAKLLECYCLLSDEKKKFLLILADMLMQYNDLCVQN